MQEPTTDYEFEMASNTEQHHEVAGRAGVHNKGHGSASEISGKHSKNRQGWTSAKYSKTPSDHQEADGAGGNWNWRKILQGSEPSDLLLGFRRQVGTSRCTRRASAEVETDTDSETHFLQRRTRLGVMVDHLMSPNSGSNSITLLERPRTAA